MLCFVRDSSSRHFSNRSDDPWSRVMIRHAAPYYFSLLLCAVWNGDERIGDERIGKSAREKEVGGRHVYQRDYSSQLRTPCSNDSPPALLSPSPSLDEVSSFLVANITTVDDYAESLHHVA